MMTARRRYTKHRYRAKMRGIAFHLTFDEWLDIWTKSGQYNQMGQLPGQYVMARHGDAGAYEVGNVEIITSNENRRRQQITAAMKAKMSASHAGKPLSENHRKSIGLGQIGRTFSMETRARMSEAAHNRGRK